ncbi:hypothetical protein BH11MYX4_BH11MYX4_44510 [soil metagenome]
MLTLATAACSASEPLGGSMTPACEGASVPVLAGLRPGVPVDYLATYVEHLDWGLPPEPGPARPDAPGERWERTDTTIAGTPCANATDRAACTAKLEALRVTHTPCSTGNGQYCVAQYLVYTRGDEVGTAQAVPEIARLLAPIDTKEEALYLVGLDGLALDCSTEPGPKWSAVPGGGFDVLGETPDRCTTEPEPVEQVVVRVAPDGSRTELARQEIRKTKGGCSEGRRPVGLASSGDDPACARDLGAYFARSAHLEAASVVAFDRLATELEVLGAPRALLRRVARAGREEMAHARTTTRLALRYGRTPPAVRVRRFRERTALAIALDNAREGCVRETLCAAIALHRAARALDPAIADAYRRIAEDELGHARLSWDLAAWLDSRLTLAERARVRRAMAREIDATARELYEEPSATLTALAGAPSAAITRALYDHLTRRIWAPALAA